MTRRLLTFSVLAVVAVSGAAITVFACGDKDKTADASTASATAGHEGCAAKGASAGARCPYHTSGAAMTAAGDHCGNGASAKTTAVTAANSNCAAHKTSAAGFDAAVSGTASCGGKGVGTMANDSHHDCDACADMALCEQQLKSLNSNFQVVPLKNGVMYVYTAEKGKDVRAVQAAIARRTEHLNALLAADHVKLCPDCKSMRGAMASGKLNREVVNIELGSISLVTSNDPSLVGKLYAMAGLGNQRLVKS